MTQPFEIEPGSQPENAAIVPVVLNYDALPPELSRTLLFGNTLPVLKAKIMAHRLKNMGVGDSPYVAEDLPPFICVFGIFSDDFGGVAPDAFVMRQNGGASNDANDGHFTYSPYEEAARRHVRDAEAGRLWDSAEDMSGAGTPKWRRVFQRLLRDGPDGK